jgi:hypothetical protein
MTGFFLALAIIWVAAHARPQELPPGVTEIPASEPLEISGVAAIGGGFAVVGDDDASAGRIWPGGGSFPLRPKVYDAEAIDIARSPFGEALWLVLSEDDRTVFDRAGGSYKLPARYGEICGRGLEGLALRWTTSGWRVAVLWEGGAYNHSCFTRPRDFDRPRVAFFGWKKGKGMVGPLVEIELAVPGLPDDQYFRAPDLVWHEDDLLVLLASMARWRHRFAHTWLQRFSARTGAPIGSAVKLEVALGKYRDGKGLVMGYDAMTGHRALAVFNYPLESSGTIPAGK